MNAKELINQMTLEEKCSLLSGGTQFTTKSIPRLGVPSIYCSDGPIGVRKQAGAADHLGLNPSLPSTCFPSASTMANAWNPALCEEMGRALGEEAKALGVNVLLGPGLNMKRSPLCGRNFEYYSEDPILAGKLAAGYIRGLQENGIAACPKHFAVNSQETLRMHSDSVLDERTMREIYLTAFEIAVKEGHPKSIMSPYNRINGTYASENRKLLREILVEEWGFDGFVVTDWGGSNDRVQAVAAGNHLEMPETGGSSDREVARAVREGRLSEGAVDTLVEEYLRAIDHIAIPPDAPGDFDVDAHHALARRLAEETIVLLKNEGDLLPLKPGCSVAVIGDFAQTPRFQGGGSSAVNATRVDTALDELAKTPLNILGFAPGFFRLGGEDAQKRQEAVELAKRAEVVLFFLGQDELAETEGMDRLTMKLRDDQIETLQAVTEVNPRVVVVLSGGAPVECPWLELCPAAVHGYLGGQGGAAAMAKVLTGAVNPSGKLAETWPLTYEDTPAYRHFPGQEKTAEYREGLYIGYRYYDTADLPVRFPFGFGLSYTTFAYSDLTLSPEEVTFTLTNTGALAGAEVAQLYVSRQSEAVFRPRRELKGFAKVFLNPGESRRITIPLDDKAFRYFNVKTGRWEVEGGCYTLAVAASSRDIRLTGQVNLAGTDAPAPYDTAALPSYFSGKVADVGDGEFAALLGRAIPPARWDRAAPLELNDTFAQLSYAQSPIGRLVYRVFARQLDRARKAGKPDLNALFRMNMPFRGMGKMMGGAVDMDMAAALVEVFNGHFFRGVAHLAGAWRQKGKAARETRKKLESKGENAL